MSTSRRTRRPGAVVLWLLVVVPTAMYFLNPFGATGDSVLARLTGRGVYRVPSESMAPTIPAETLVVVDMRASRARVSERGEIVAFHPPGDTQATHLSRVVAVAGDRVAVSGLVVTVNGRALEEPYARWEGEATVETAEDVVPDGSVFLLGDNRSKARDSRLFGPLPRAALAGVYVGRW